MYYILPDYSLFNNKTTQTINPQEKVKKKLEGLFKPKTNGFEDIKITNDEIEIINVNKAALKDKRKYKQTIIIKFTKPGPKPKEVNTTSTKKDVKSEINKPKNEKIIKKEKLKD